MQRLPNSQNRFTQALTSLILFAMLVGCGGSSRESVVTVIDDDPGTTTGTATGTTTGTATGTATGTTTGTATGTATGTTTGTATGTATGTTTGTTTGTATGTTTGTATGTTTGTTTETTTGTIGDTTGTTTGEEEPIVDIVMDCRNTLPCTWDTENRAVTLTFADGSVTNGSGNFAVDFIALSKTRDTRYGLTSSSQVTAGGQQLNAAQTLFGTNQAFSNRPAEVDLVAGVEVSGSIGFTDELNPGLTQLDRLNLTFEENEVPFTAIFANAPTGRSDSGSTDCANELPCIWTSPDSRLSLSINTVAESKASQFSATQFAVTFTATSLLLEERFSLGLGGRNTAISNTGNSFSTSSTNLADIRGFTSTNIQSLLEPGIAVVGVVQFTRAATDLETSLAQLSLVLFESVTPRVPRYNPIFLNLPITQVED